MSTPQKRHGFHIFSALINLLQLPSLSLSRSHCIPCGQKATKYTRTMCNPRCRRKCCNPPIERKKRGRAGGRQASLLRQLSSAMRAIKSCQIVSSLHFDHFSSVREGGGSVFSRRSKHEKSLRQCLSLALSACQVRISRFHRLFDRDQTEEEGRKEK